jgi:hypothetical protein
MVSSLFTSLAMRQDLPLLYVDFNEMVEPNLVLLSAGDTKNDRFGALVQLREGMPIRIYSDDESADGKPDNLIAQGTVEKNKATGWSSHVKWCCRIDSNGINHESSLKVKGSGEKGPASISS